MLPIMKESPGREWERKQSRRYQGDRHGRDIRTTVRRQAIISPVCLRITRCGNRGKRHGSWRCG